MSFEGKHCLAAMLVLILASPGFAQSNPTTAMSNAEKRAAAIRAAPKPTQANVAYGPAPEQVLDFWKAESTRPTPLVFYIHGGGWRGNDKDLIHHPDKAIGAPLERFLAAGISVVTINYRKVPAAQAAEIKPPVSWPLGDAARALQFVRSKAIDWNIDKTRIGATGSSAGGCSSLWLAFHNDMADPKSSDPVARESTRLACAGVNRPQTSLDPKQMKEWIPNSVYGGHAFGIVVKATPGERRDPNAEFQQFLDQRESLLSWIKEYSPYEWVTADDPPIYLFFTTRPAVGKEEKDPTHSANFGAKLDERLKEVGVESHLMYPGATGTTYQTAADFLIAKLRVSEK